MLKSSQKSIECLLGFCDHEAGDSSCLFQKVIDRDKDYIFNQIEKIIRLEAKTELMKEKTKKSKEVKKNETNKNKNKQSKGRKDAKKSK